MGISLRCLKNERLNLHVEESDWYVKCSCAWLKRALKVCAERNYFIIDAGLHNYTQKLAERKNAIAI